MKSKSLFWKLFPTYFFISLFGLFLLLIITRYAVENFYFSEITKHLIDNARIVQKDFSDALADDDIEFIRNRVELITKSSDNRITIISLDGNVLADSSFNQEKMENHKTREEIKLAFSGKTGKSIRYSDTLKKKFLYIAIPLIKNNKIIGVVRNSMSTDKLYTELRTLTQRVLFWSGVLGLILSSLIYIKAKQVSFPLEEFKEQIDKLRGFDSLKEIKLSPGSSIEVQALANTINEIGSELNEKIDKVVKQKEEQEAVFSSMIEGVITTDNEGKIFHINKAALILFDINETSLDNLKGMPLSKVVLSKKINKLAQELLDTGLPLEVELERSNGQIIEVNASILKTPSQEMMGALLVFHDISRLRKLEGHRKEFVANVSHELRTPLTSIQGFLETLIDGEIDNRENLVKFLGIIKKHTIRLNTIIEDLLKLSRIEKDNQDDGIELSTQSLAPVISSSVLVCNKKAEKKNDQFNIVCDPEIKCNINAPLLEQVFVNLIDNAIKYSPENSEISIDVSLDDSKYIIINIADQGAGIPAEHHKRLFERFYSVDKARSRELGGTGLGLSIAKHIVLAHNGEITLKNNIPHGTIFSVFLPKRA